MAHLEQQGLVRLYDQRPVRHRSPPFPHPLSMSDLPAPLHAEISWPYRL
jgi:hypothetical protein